MNHGSAISAGLALIFEGIGKLKESFPDKAFTIDGRLVGDIGEVLATAEFDITLYPVQTPTHDGETSDNRKVQIKATFKNSLTMTSVPDLYLGLKLWPDGRHEVIYNGPGAMIAEAFSHRSGIGTKQLSFSTKSLQVLAAKVPEDQKVRSRAITGSNV